MTGGWQGGGHKVQRALRKGHERRCEKKQGLTWFARHRGTGNRSGQVRSGPPQPLRGLYFVCKFAHRITHFSSSGSTLDAATVYGGN